jgi:hypothetical protein
VSITPESANDPVRVFLADKAAKLQRGAPTEGPSDGALPATLDGIEARYGRSPLSERLREQLERWPER